ncbi:MAG: rRNA maturation RNase YbeY [Dehalococcoidales bacterium]|jgi:probable rRNA maturation factor|nr:rRNA maturation RNase YbeY [Dehalococcoidales bacterium]
MEISILFDKGLKDCLEVSWLKAIAEQVLTSERADPDVEMGLVIASQKKSRQLNKTYLGKDRPTDVLSFPMLDKGSTANQLSFAIPPDGIVHLGEVIISYPQAVKQAEEHCHSVKKEIAILIIHGVLHLLGYDHDTLEPRRVMSTAEMTILNSLKGGLD